MNKHQFIVYWMTVLLISIGIFPLFYFVFEFELLNGIIISFIIIVLIWGTSIFFSLRGKDENRLIETWKLIRKFLIPFGSVLAILLIYLAIQLIISYIQNKDLENKRQILQEHIQKEYWFTNNLILSSGQLRTNEDRSFSEYRILKELNFIVQNKSTLDFSTIDLSLSIYNSNGNLFGVKKIHCWKSIHSNSREKITEYFFSEKDNLVPSDYSWEFIIESAKVSVNYLSDHSFDQIEYFIIADSLSLRNPILERLKSIDWDTVDVN